MSKPSDVRVVDCELYFIPVTTRIPLKFGPETTTHTTCARTRITVRDGAGKETAGWGETPLSVAWVWPSSLTFAERDEALREFTRGLAKKMRSYPVSGHPMEISRQVIDHDLPKILDDFNRGRQGKEPMPWLAALVCYSLFDIAIHDAYAIGLGLFVYDIYTAKHMNHDLSWYYGDAYATMFAGKYPADFFVAKPPKELRAWHLIGGKDILRRDDLTGDEPDDGYPVLLPDWIDRDGLKCLKVKLTGTDPVWDYERLVLSGEIAIAKNVEWLTADFNCTVHEPAYVCEILDRLVIEYPRIAAMILYVEQPFPYDIKKYPIDVHALSARKPLFMDESAHDWHHVVLGRELGWTGVALKTCKTQTGALLSMCWAKAHGMTLMVQDLSNPMLAQIPHLLLAAHVGTIMGVETNSMQFFTQSSDPEAAVHPGVFRRRHGVVSLESLGRTGFGFRVDEIKRVLPPPETL